MSIDKIKKLFAISADPNASEGEKQSAIEMAYKLMMKHHIDESQVRDHKIKPKLGTDNHDLHRSRAYNWEIGLAYFITKFTGTQFFYSRDKGFVFYGTVVESQSAKEFYSLFHYLILTSATIRYGGAFRKDGGSYSEGFVRGLYYKLEKAKEATSYEMIHQVNDLILAKNKESNSWLEETMGVKLKTKAVALGATGSTTATRQGFNDAQKVDLNKKRKLT